MHTSQKFLNRFLFLILITGFICLASAQQRSAQATQPQCGDGGCDSAPTQPDNQALLGGTTSRISGERDSSSPNQQQTSSPDAPAKSAGSYQGFGATTLGGAGATLVHVTNLNDSGPGSLREAVQQGNRTIVFDVAGDILLDDYIYVAGANITIDGFSAPSPGITLRNRGLVIRGNRGAHDVIVRGLRIRNSPLDGLQVAWGAYNIVIDHVSVANSGDGNLDITESAHDITVSWSIFTGNSKNMLIKYNPSRITLHHNIFAHSVTRNPQIRIDNAGTLATDTTVDMRNNIIWDWDIGYGTLVWYGPRVNVVNNYYSSSDDALSVEATTSKAYVQGNASADNADLNLQSTEANPFPAPFVETHAACDAATLVLANAGARPLDSIDQGTLSPIQPSGCQAEPPLLPRLEVSSGSLSFNSLLGGPAPTAQALNITNAGGGTLSWQASAVTTSGNTWLTVSPDSDVAPSNVTVSVNPLGLPEGSYQGTVSVTASGATNSPQEIPVTLVVSPPFTGPGVLQLDIMSGGEDAWEHDVGAVRTSTAYLPPGQATLIGLRFTGVSIPPGAVIESAALQMFALGNTTYSVALRYCGEATADSPPFNSAQYNLSNRQMTTACVDDSPAPWIAESFNSSPDLSAIIQEIVSTPLWNAGNNLSLFIEDTGSLASRIIGSYESKPTPSKRPVLSITYTDIDDPTPPIIALALTDLSFTAQSGESFSPPQTVSITNLGGGVLNWTSTVTTADGAPWLSVSPTLGTAPSALEVRVDSTNLQAGSYDGTVSIAAANASNPPQAVSIALEVSPPTPAPPEIALSDVSLSFSTTIGESTPSIQEGAVSNSGGGVLQWNASIQTEDGGGWLSISPSAGTAPSSLIAQLNPSGLPVGLYEGTIIVEAAGAVNSPQSLPVTLVIDPRPDDPQTLYLSLPSREADSWEHGAGAVKTSVAYLLAGRDYHLAFRFTDVGIPQGAIIESAMLELYGLGNVDREVHLRYLGEATSNSAPLGLTSYDISNRLKTLAHVDEEAPEAWQLNTYNPSPDLSPILQEIIAHPNWVPGNSLALFIEDIGSNDARRIGSFESKPVATKAAGLVITYRIP